MNLLELIETKKFGKRLSDEQIRFFAKAAADPSTPDYQLAALLMAIRLMGMDDAETACLTRAMADTGDVLQPDIGGVPVDKHSTGGVGDTTTLILVPLVAASGGKVMKMSGRGLGHTGGTLDKMESIPHMRVELTEEECLRVSREVGCCVVGQTGELVPADKRLYALRDVTGTVDAVPLIASSIMSKKLAGGAEGIVLDVKTGSGAIMKTTEACIALAEKMVAIGRMNGRKVTALITSMDEPLGSHIGNALEVKEAIDVLAGRTEGPLLEVSLLLGGQMLVLGGVAKDEQEAGEKLMDALRSGRGLKKLAEMIRAQGGDPACCEDVTKLPQAKALVPVAAPLDGYIHTIDAARIGLAAQGLGAGRRTKEDVIDPAVGLVMHRRIGDFVRKGEPIATLHVSREGTREGAARAVLEAVRIRPERAEKSRLLYAKVTEKETVRY